MSNCKVIALTNQKGGVGKTTTAVNLGVSLVQQGKKVLLIDADAQANLTMALGYNRPDDIPITLSTVMQNIIDDKTLDVSQGIIHHREGVDLLPSNIELSGFEVRLINAMSRERVLKTYVNEVKKNYDYVLIDCMPSLGMITINALAAADSVIIPTQPHYLSAKGLELLLRSVSMVKRQINPKLRIDGILMTMVMPRTNISKEITATVKSAYGISRWRSARPFMTSTRKRSWEIWTAWFSWAAGKAPPSRRFRKTGWGSPPSICRRTGAPKGSRKATTRTPSGLAGS